MSNKLMWVSVVVVRVVPDCVVPVREVSDRVATSPRGWFFWVLRNSHRHPTAQDIQTAFVLT